jgi:hypothetical protein
MGEMEIYIKKNIERLISGGLIEKMFISYIFFLSPKTVEVMDCNGLLPLSSLPNTL